MVAWLIRSKTARMIEADSITLSTRGMIGEASMLSMFRKTQLGITSAAYVIRGEVQGSSPDAHELISINLELHFVARNEGDLGVGLRGDLALRMLQPRFLVDRTFGC